MTRIARLLALILILISFRLTGQPINPDKDGKYGWFNFNWEGYTVGSHHFEKAAIFVPIKVNSLKGNLVAQFDLGSNETIVYGNTIKNYFGSRAALLSLVDTTTKTKNESGVVCYTTNGIDITMGTIVKQHVTLFDEFGDDNPKDSLYTPTPKIVATIGADIMQGKVLIIDYPRQRMCLLDTLDNFWASRTTFVHAKLQNNRIHIPFAVNGRTYWFLFDTGASIFPLSTDSGTWNKISGSVSPTDSLLIDTWGKKALVFGGPAKNDIYLGNLKMTRGNVWYSDFKPWLDIYREAGVSGLTGNAFFLEKTIAIDFKNQRFGIVREVNQ